MRAPTPHAAPPVELHRDAIFARATLRTECPGRFGACRATSISPYRFHSPDVNLIRESNACS